MFCELDVKPIVSFDESPVQVSNALALREESSVVISSPNDANAIAGPSAAQTGNYSFNCLHF